MVLPGELVSELVKVTTNTVEVKQETTVYGTIVEYEGSKYVRLDGSDLLTPVTMTTDVKAEDRVTVMIKNHTAIVTGNMTSPAARSESVEQIGDRISEAEILIADKVSTKYFDAEVARIDKLTAENVTIKGELNAQKASIDELEAENATITGELKAQKASVENLEANKLSATDADLKYATITELDATNADIHNLEADYGEFVELTAKNFEATNATVENLEATKIDATEVNAKYATIENLNAAKVEVDTLEADYGEFKTLTTDKLEANDATIKNLQADKLSAKDADLKYANIDFSNIGEAAIEYFYATSGLIEDVTIENGKVTGHLVGVTISGDLIEGNTIVAEKLVIKGEDGLYYQLNTNGVTVEAEQTEYNSINGSIITAKSITATKIDVTDLEAFNATIGGLKLTAGAIYSGVKESIDNTTRGLYLDKEGQFFLGDANNFVKFYKDEAGDYRLRISAEELEVLSSAVQANSENISSLRSDNKSLNLSIKDLETVVSEGLEGVNDDITAVTKMVETKISPEEVQVQISTALAGGVGKVHTSTGYTFDSDGLTVSKTGSEMTTKITEDGMQVFKNEKAVLTANNAGVDAVNLHASTYLIIGENSRLEDWNNRTACFWIGGNA